MADAEVLAEVYRGDFLESVHFGHAVVARPDGTVVDSWGDPHCIILPRSSAKMLQALPLVECGAAKHLSPQQLALVCSSHSGEGRHVRMIRKWLKDLNLTEGALRCGPEPSRDRHLLEEMIREGQPATPAFNNCSGKHTGCLTFAARIIAGSDYTEPDHPVQKAARAAMEEMTGVDCPGYAIDGCSAPNFATSVRGLACAMAKFAVAGQKSGSRDQSAAALRDAMIAHPELVSGKGRTCADIMVAANGRVAVKTGAEGVYVAIIPDLGIGLALKVADGASRASQLAIVGLLVRLGALDPRHPIVARYLQRPIINWAGIVTGFERPAPGLLG